MFSWVQLAFGVFFAFELSQEALSDRSNTRLGIWSNLGDYALLAALTLGSSSLTTARVSSSNRVGQNIQTAFEPISLGPLSENVRSVP